MQLSKKQIDLMKHCVGLHRGKPYRRHGKLFYKPSRNYFDCGKHDDPDWGEFAAMPWTSMGKVGISSQELGFLRYQGLLVSIFSIPLRAKRHWPIRENFLSSTQSAWLMTQDPPGKGNYAVFLISQTASLCQ